MHSASDATTYLKKPLELEEKNPNGSQRIIFWRDRPIHSFAKNFFSRLFATNSTLTHWAIQVGEDYVWELAIDQGKMRHHVGVWLVLEKERAPFVGTERDGDPKNHNSTRGQEIGRTCMTDFEIHAKGNAFWVVIQNGTKFTNALHSWTGRPRHEQWERSIMDRQVDAILQPTSSRSKFQKALPQMAKRAPLWRGEQ